MSDLISRKQAIEAMGEEPYVWSEDDEYLMGQRSMWVTAVTILRALPPVEPEIIKCKECKHSWFSGTATIRGKSYEIYKCNYWDDRVVSSNGYCWVAERRTDEGN